MTALLTDLSQALAQTVESAGSFVVRVEGRRRIPASGILWDESGTVVTANHVVRQDENIRIALPDGANVTASVVGRDPSTDLAVLNTSATGFSPAKASDEMRVGHLVLALGRPGHTVQATLGIISALGDEPWRTPAGGQIDRYLQTDVVMYPGFSGGPLVSVAGNVLGLNTSALLRGVSLAVPGSTVRTVVETLLAHGRVRRGYLGVSTQPVRLPADASKGLDQETGLLVIEVEQNSPADHGGLLLGDTIVALDGSVVRHHDDLLLLLGGNRVGQKVPVEVVRGGQRQTLKVTIGER